MTDQGDQMIERLYTDFAELKKVQSNMQVSLSELKTDVRWIKESLAELNTCKICRNQDNITARVSEHNKEIVELKENISKVNWTAVGISAGVSFTTATLLFILKIKEFI